MNITKVDRAITSIQNLIDSGQLRENGRLPSERELCLKFDVSRNTIRAALDRLEAGGKIWRRSGSGTYAGERPIEKQLGLIQIGSATSPMELMDLRLILEPPIARLAARNASKSEIERMQYIVKKCEMATNSISYEKWDAALHNSIAAATQNNLIKATFQSINDIRGLTLWGQLRDRILSDGAQKHWSRQHQAFVDAIASRDGALAETLAREHVLEVREKLNM